jgi:hypothetical protein
VKQFCIAAVGCFEEWSLHDLSLLRRVATQRTIHLYENMGPTRKFAHYIDKVSVISRLDNGTLLIASRRSILWAKSSVFDTPRLAPDPRQVSSDSANGRGSENRWIVCVATGLHVSWHKYQANVSASVTLSWF